MGYPVSYLVQFLLEAAAFLTITAVGVSRLREGPWAVLATAGGALASIIALVQLDGYVEAKFTNSSVLFDLLFRHSLWVNDVFAWARAAGFVLIAAAIVALAQLPRRA